MQRTDILFSSVCMHRANKPNPVTLADY